MLSNKPLFIDRTHQFRNSLIVICLKIIWLTWMKGSKGMRRKSRELAKLLINCDSGLFLKYLRASKI